MGPVNHFTELLWLARTSGGFESTPLLREGSAGAGCSGPCPVGFECFQGWSLQNLFRQPLPMVDNLHSKKGFSYVSKPLFSIFLCLLACDAEPRDNDKVTNTAPWEQLYPDHLKGFEHRCQVMSDKSLYFSRHYFGVEMSGADIYLGMTYRSVDQTGSESYSCISGNNFWSTLRNGKRFSAWHSNVEIPSKWMCLVE